MVLLFVLNWHSLHHCLLDLLILKNEAILSVARIPAAFCFLVLCALAAKKSSSRPLSTVHSLYRRDGSISDGNCNMLLYKVESIFYCCLANSLLQLSRFIFSTMLLDARR